MINRRAVIFILIIGILFIGCVTTPGTQGPTLGQPTLLQTELNRLPAIPIAGRNLNFQFGGDTWIATLGGRNFLAGSVITYETREGIYLVLNQTHTFPPAGTPTLPGVQLTWIRTPGPEIILAFIVGPPSSMRLIPGSQQPPDLLAARESAATTLAAGPSQMASSSTSLSHPVPATVTQAGASTYYLEQPIPRLVIIPLENRAGAAHANDIETLTILIGDFINDTKRLSVIDRSTFNTAMSVNRWQMNDWGDEKKAAEMGRVIDADYIARGTVSRLGNSFIISMRINDIFSAETVSNTTIQIPNIDDAFGRLGELANNLTRTIPAQPPRQQQQVPPLQLLSEPLPVQEQSEAQIQELFTELQRAEDQSTQVNPDKIQESFPSFTEQDKQVQIAQIKDDSWKHKWFYLGPSLGISFYNYTAREFKWLVDRWEENKQSGALFTLGIITDLNLFPWLSITTGFYLGAGSGHSIPYIPLLLRIGGKGNGFELTGNVGYSFWNVKGFTIGSTLGFNVGKTEIFYFDLNHVWGSILGFDGRLITISLGIKFGMGNKKGQVKPVEMIWVPSGSFELGRELGTQGSGDATPVSTVNLTGFYIGKYPVTQAQYLAVMGFNPSNFKTSNGIRPVESVNWYDAIVFCNRLSIKEGLTPAYSIFGTTNPDHWGSVPTTQNTTWDAVLIISGSTGYRLPTEAQWEFAAKGGVGTPGSFTYAGGNNADTVAWHYGNSGSRTYEVGKKDPNGLGLYDMSGNVWEWCWDYYGSYTSEEKTDPTGASSGSNRVIRGGSWDSLAHSTCSVDRGSSYPYYRSNNFGFRLLRP